MEAITCVVCALRSCSENPRLTALTVGPVNTDVDNEAVRLLTQSTSLRTLSVWGAMTEETAFALWVRTTLAREMASLQICVLSCVLEVWAVGIVCVVGGGGVPSVSLRLPLGLCSFLPLPPRLSFFLNLHVSCSFFDSHPFVLFVCCCAN